MTSTFFNKQWVETLRAIHKEMMDEKALFEELSDEADELTESDKFKMYHYFSEGENDESDDE